MVLSVKISCFFLILLFKGPQFKDNLPFSNLKCPFFCRIPLNRSKKWSWDKKMRVTHHLLGIWPRKHSRSSMHQLKTHFGVNSPLFQLKCSVLFSGIMINWLKNLLGEKKNGCHPSNYGYLTHKTPSEHGKTQFPQIL